MFGKNIYRHRTLIFQKFGRKGLPGQTTQSRIRWQRHQIQIEVMIGKSEYLMRGVLYGGGVGLRKHASENRKNAKGKRAAKKNLWHWLFPQPAHLIKGLMPLISWPFRLI